MGTLTVGDVVGSYLLHQGSHRRHLAPGKWRQMTVGDLIEQIKTGGQGIFVQLFASILLPFLRGSPPMSLRPRSRPGIPHQ